MRKILRLKRDKKFYTLTQEQCDVLEMNLEEIDRVRFANADRKAMFCDIELEEDAEVDQWELMRAVGNSPGFLLIGVG